MAKKESKSKLQKLQESGTLVKLGEMNFDCERIPTNITPLDIALGGGLPRGRIVEAFGPEAGGKSAIALMASGAAQEYGQVAYIDLENTLDPNKAENSGIVVDNLFISQPSSTEDTFELLLDIAEMPDFSLVVVDSVATMVPQAEINGDMGDSIVGVQARLMSQGLRKLNQAMIANDSQTIFFFVNQIREKVGGFGGFGGGPQTTTTGGRALKFYSSVRLEVARIGQWKQGEAVVGQEVRVKVAKNKYAPPFRQANFKLHYEHGVSNEAALIEEAKSLGLIEQSGAWFKDPASGESLAQGEFKMIDYLRENRNYFEDLRERVLSAS